MRKSPASTAPKPSGLDCRLAVLGTDARLTPHRREVFQVLAESTDHPTAYDVFDRVKGRSPGLSRGTWGPGEAAGSASCHVGGEEGLANMMRIRAQAV
jgi:hypothetical protein